MDRGIIIAVIATIISPLILSWATGRQRRKEKVQDWAREDEVARRAQVAADNLLAGQTEATRQAKKAAAATKSALKEIHTLVNSDMTAARQSELTQTRALLVLMQAQTDPTESDIAAMDAQEIRVAELENILADRLDAQRKVEMETKLAEEVTD
jgi:flagellar biosynthesis GTPase FlhF